MKNWHRYILAAAFVAALIVGLMIPDPPSVASSPVKVQETSPFAVGIPAKDFVTAMQVDQYLSIQAYLIAHAPRAAVTYTTVSTTSNAPVATTDLYAAWTKVAVCEEGGWIGSSGSAYPDSLGITAQNWYANGGGSDMSPAAQIAVAMRVSGGWIPDQNGCAAW